MNSIHIEEESAIIPLKRLNEMKANEKIFADGLEYNPAYKKIYSWEPSGGEPKNIIWFILNANEIKEAIEKSFEGERQSHKYTRSELDVLRNELVSRDDEILRLRKKKWYQFVKI